MHPSSSTTTSASSRTGDRAKAAEYLTTATTMYREMDMVFWLAQAEAASKLP